jgi:hypothetical protein
VRVAAVIMLVLLALGGCRSTSVGRPAGAPAALAHATAPLSCTPWPDGERLRAEPKLLRSVDQDLPGTDTGFGPPAQVTVGLACLILPADVEILGFYCGAADPGGAPQPCLIGEECAVGSIMATEVKRFEEVDGIATCAVFENWSRNRARTITLWARTR